MAALPAPLHILDLPFNQFMEISVSDEEPHALVLPRGERYTNHVGTVHAAALYALGEACCGHRLLLAIEGRTDRYVPLLRRSAVKYQKPAHGALIARPEAKDGAIEKLLSDLNERGRSLITIEAEIEDEKGEVVMAASYDWYVHAADA